MVEDARKNKRSARKSADGKGSVRARGKDSAKRFLAKVKAPPPQGFPATAPGSRPHDERKPGARERGSPDASGDRALNPALDDER
jgi:hypothetical protein